jgi:hypothetical protein
VAKVPARAEARTEPRPEPRPEPRKQEAPKPIAAQAAVVAPPEPEFVPVRPLKVEPRRPPPPVVPVLGKGVKAKKKKSHD